MFAHHDFVVGTARWRYQVEAFKAAGLILIRLKGWKPESRTVNALQPSQPTGGRPAYSLLQLYSSLSLTLGWL